MSSIGPHLWIVFLSLAALCFVIGSCVLSANKLIATSGAVHDHAPQSTAMHDGETIMPTDPLIPANWNEFEITNELRQLRDDRPSLIPHYVNSVLERFVTRQDDRTAQ